MEYIESKTALKVGWGSMPYRYVTRLTPDEKQAVKDGHVVWFSFPPWHYKQSGFKVVIYRFTTARFDSREPTTDELERLKEVSN